MKPLIELLPEELNYGESPEMTAIQSALTAAAEDVWAARESFAEQLSPATATWGLCAWEEALALAPADKSDLVARRRAIIAKLRGAGTSTPERILSVAKAELGDEVWVLEYPGEYRVEIRVRLEAAPGDFGALTRTLKEIMPAHLRWGYGLEYPTTTSTLYLGAAATSGSETELPEWRKDYNFIQTIKVVGAFGVISVTELPPVE